MSLRPQVLALARDCGFELAGITPAVPAPDAAPYLDWVRAGMAGEMTYLIDSKAEIRQDPRRLLPSARSILCVGKLYNVPKPYSTRFHEPDLGWISRYAWGDDYHVTIRKSLKKLVERLREAAGPFDWKICVDTAPLLERTYARLAGLGWIGKNTCLINQAQGSWFFLAELLISLDLDPDSAPPDRCGTCTRCIEACPTQAIVPAGRPDGPAWTIDSRLCISYFTIELRGAVPEQHRAGIGSHIFGCDICQDVCPWNRKAPVTGDPAFAAAHYAPPLERMAALTEDEFRELFRRTPVSRARYHGFLRNVAIAMGNSGLNQFKGPLEKLSASDDEVIARHAEWALGRIASSRSARSSPNPVPPESGNSDRRWPMADRKPDRTPKPA